MLIDALLCRNEKAAAAMLFLCHLQGRRLCALSQASWRVSGDSPLQEPISRPINNIFLLSIDSSRF